MLPFFKIAVGTWAWGNRLIWDYGIDFDEKDLAELVRNAISKGSRYFFTSESFSDGFGEALLGKLAEPYPNAFLATKYVPRIWRPGRKDFSLCSCAEAVSVWRPRRFLLVLRAVCGDWA